MLILKEIENLLNFPSFDPHVYHFELDLDTNRL